MKRLRRAPEPTRAMEPWLRSRPLDDKLLIEKINSMRSSDRSKAVAKAVGYTCAKDSCGNALCKGRTNKFAFLCVRYLCRYVVDKPRHGGKERRRQRREQRAIDAALAADRAARSGCSRAFTLYSCDNWAEIIGRLYP